jgi:hypothetical protein
MPNEALKREINRLNLSIIRKVCEIIGIVLFVLLLAITFYEYFFLGKDPSNYRVLIILIMLIQSK